MENWFSSMVICHFKVKEGVTKEKLNKTCDGKNDFLLLSKVLHEFAQQDQTYGAQHAVDHLNPYKSYLDT